VAWLCGVRVVALCGMVVHGARGGAVWPWVRVVALFGMGECCMAWVLG
jgi:hypothetical protein